MKCLSISLFLGGLFQSLPSAFSFPLRGYFNPHPLLFHSPWEGISILTLRIFHSPWGVVSILTLHFFIPLGRVFQSLPCTFFIPLGGLFQSLLVPFSFQPSTTVFLPRYSFAPSTMAAQCLSRRLAIVALKTLACFVTFRIHFPSAPTVLLEISPQFTKEK